MNNTLITIVIVVVVVVVAIGIMLNNRPAPAVEETPIRNDLSDPNLKSETLPTSATAGAVVDVEEGVPATKEVAGTYTMASVAAHNNASSCWAAVSGAVYDLTAWIGQHPGGEDKILRICGKDGSAAFNGQHGGEARPASELAEFKIGMLAK